MEMRVFLAGMVMSNLLPDFSNHGFDLLESYHYMTARKPVWCREHGVKLFLDSGGFSARSLGASIDIVAYADWLEQHEDIVEIAANLDAPIGENEESFKNWQYLHGRFGDRVKPVIHLPSDPGRWLNFYLDKGCDHILLGGMAGGNYPGDAMRKELDKFWGGMATDKDGKPLCKIHGFGMTAIDLMIRYPWYSVDSTSWLFGGKTGTIYFEENNGKRYKFNASAKNPSIKDMGMHITTLPEPMQNKIREVLESEGVTWDECLHSYKHRNLVNAWYFHRLRGRGAKTFHNQELEIW